jgi:hypothetical protein
MEEGDERFVVMEGMDERNGCGLPMITVATFRVEELKAANNSSTAEGG